ncbi:FmdE family protein [Salidesulfovibrio onnuriiensis]|uniref:FmdE family protein n=1 Tax=Salidesulfovibrio onnuriiensis TaxID=2583823 RepID=UPI0011C96225|nr:FmdE family protein [Salidesulfovibrio onnuriiensis]
MSTTIPRERIEATIDFHGHVCPGLSIGIRAAELCLREFGHNNDTPLTTICETDMCGVDAIQFLTGCTFGKGNLIHRDWGKNAFTFYRKNDGKGLRALLRPEAMGPNYAECRDLMKKSVDGTATPEEEERLALLRREQQQNLMDAPLEEVFHISEPDTLIPRPAKILATLVCDHCGEGAMESRTRRFDGQTLCIPCFSKVEQKV